MLPRILSSIFVFLVAVGAATVGCGERTICDDLEGLGCDDCYGELMRCEFDGVEATERSCNGDCQARVAVLHELCASGSEATFEEANAGMTCEPVEDTAAP